MVFENWIQPIQNSGPGNQVISLNDGTVYYIATLATQMSESSSLPTEATIVGSTGRGSSVKSGTAVYTPFSEGFNVTLKYTVIQEQNNIQNSNFLLTDKSIVVNKISDNAVYRVGSFNIRNITNNEILGTQYFQGYGDVNSNIAIGTQTFVLQNQLFFSNLFTAYKDINNPKTTLLNLSATIAGGQRFAKYTTFGIEQTLPYNNTLDQTCSLFIEEKLAILPKTLNYTFAQRQTYLFDFTPEDPRGIVRLGTFDILDTITKERVGTEFYQTYVQDTNVGTGTFVSKIDGKGAIFDLILHNWKIQVIHQVFELQNEPLRVDRGNFNISIGVM